ncbi:TonB-dependent siderophore receptor [Aliarcobacter butzleri]|uniref:TonB-denpendent receptor n=1 Tax=Aliarcobacter butzleri L351 TaxID=1447259 RepID=A0A837J5M1_9BACT|nr:TonB-dependent receptor [Aliarcobacter butzleri]KLE00786.1 TonB-denpendent receptor [Aliarcobacter butzleri L351]KLE12892.1 TonB-denpendent receptor [Aliarcobacter butzleri L350]MDN5048177.1 TonB-dependent receptor [Aliarcobacter butzleri]
MSLLKKSLIAPSLAIFLATNLYSANYTVDTTNATKAIEKISELSNIPFIVDTNILNGKNTNKIQNVQNLDEALKLMFEGTGLEAVVKNNTIVIKKIEGKGTVLEPISVNESYKNGTAENGYLSEDITGVGLWGKRSLQDTPYSMSVISNDLIENSLAKDMNQIFKMNPTTQEVKGNSTNTGDIESTYIRGFNVRNPIVNGIPYSNGISSAPMMQDIERIEIINGATGFLYGGGRVGGAVNYITKKPTIEDLRNVTIGSYGNESYFSHIDLGGQIDDNHQFGYRTNILYQNGELADTSEKEQKNLSLVFDWKPTDNFYADIKYSYKNSLEKGANSYFASWMPDFNRSAIKKNKSYSPDWVENEIKSNKIENNITWSINDVFAIRTNTFYEKVKHKSGDSTIFLDNNGIVTYSDFSNGAWQETENYGGNIYLDVDFDTKNISHTLTTGYSLNYSKNFNHSDNWAFYYPSNNMSLDEFKNLAEPDSSLWSNSLGTQTLKPRSKIEYKNILIGDDIVFNEEWSALIGVNYASVIDTNYRVDTKYDKSELTPTLSLMYKPIEDLTTYVTYIESLEAGTIVGNTYENEGEILDPYKSKQYEIGTKYTLNESLLLTGALFRIEKANSYENNSTIKPKLTQDGEAIHEGFEVTMTGKVTDNLTLFGGGTLMDLNVEKASDKNLEGKKPTNAATKMAKLYAEYNIPQISGLTITGGAYYTGKKYADEANLDILPSYTLYDAGLRYKTKIDKYPTTFNFNIQNLTDEVYWASNFELGDPRTVAFSMKMEF